jgi:hypothetical protein
MKNAVFWNVTPCGSCKNRRPFSIVFPRSVCPLLVTANVVPISPILVTLMMQAIRFSETSVLITALQRNIPEDVIFVEMPTRKFSRRHCCNFRNYGNEYYNFGRDCM